MKGLKEIISEAEGKRVAVGHFNISDTVGFRAVHEAARELGVPVIIGVSEGERDFIGAGAVVALVRYFREKHQLPIFLNADHTHSLERVKEAALLGFDEILFDGSKLPFEENIRRTKEAVNIAKTIDPNILVEGEIGYIGSSSEILKETPQGAALDQKSFTTPEEAQKFVKETGVDVLAPAVGNMHGLLTTMVTGEVKKRLDIERIGVIKQATNIFMTLHGGSGTADEDFVAAAHAGMNIIHVSTELRVAWRRGIEDGLKNHPDEVAPYKIYPEALQALKNIVLNRLKLFNSCQKF